MNCRHATSRGTGGAAAPPDFGGSEGAACPAARRITTGPPGFLTLGASLNCVDRSLLIGNTYLSEL